MSALPPKADIGAQSWNVRFVPKADLTGLTSTRNTNGLGHHVMQKPRPLSRSLRYEKIDAGRVAAGVSDWLQGQAEPGLYLHRRRLGSLLLQLSPRAQPAGCLPWRPRPPGGGPSRLSVSADDRMGSPASACGV